MHSSKGGVRRQTLHMGCEQQLRCSAAVADCASTQPSRCVALVSEHPRVHMKCQCHRGHAAALLERLALQQMHRCHALLMGCRLRLRTSIQVVKQTGTLSSSAARQGQVQALRCCNDPQSASLTNENAVLALPGAFLGHRSFTQNPHLLCVLPLARPHAHCSGPASSHGPQEARQIRRCRAGSCKGCRGRT